VSKELLEMGWSQAESRPQIPLAESRLDAMQKNSCKQDSRPARVSPLQRSLDAPLGKSSAVRAPVLLVN